ncbi:MAG: ABC transporter substrate-binding protein [Proteobacteria bacterium]|nr:ABC transporter substrate-binding protein [Pseudomonadota bacterium]
MPAVRASMSPRIASLVPSVTELLVALGLGVQLVARTGFCIHPAEALRDVPKVGGTKDVNLAKLRRLAPTHVVVNVDENRLDTIEAIRAWGAAAPEIVVTHPRDPEHNLDLVDQLGATFGAVPGVTDAAGRIASALRRELAATQPAGRAARRVLYLIWRDPWMTVARDTYISRLLARVGWHTLPDVCGGDAGAARYPALRGDESWLAEVDDVLLSSEPYRFTERDIAAAAALCPSAAVRLVDGEMLSWYGVRAIAGLAYLRDIAMA